MYMNGKQYKKQPFIHGSVNFSHGSHGSNGPSKDDFFSGKGQPLILKYETTIADSPSTCGNECPLGCPVGSAGKRLGSVGFFTPIYPIYR